LKVTGEIIPDNHCLPCYTLKTLIGEEKMDNPWREVITDWKGETSFIARNPAGGTLQMGMIDGKPGISPMELLLAGLAGCTGMDIASILTKQRQPFVDLKGKVRGKRATDYPMVFTELEVTYLLWGENIDTKAVERAIQLSEEKYCSVGIMLAKVAPIRTSYQIFKPGEEA
jgi:putative redox protein